MMIEPNNNRTTRELSVKDMYITVVPLLVTLMTSTPEDVQNVVISGVRDATALEAQKSMY